MTHVIDSLVLELALDSSKFSNSALSSITDLRKFEDQSLKSGRAMESEGGKVVDFLTSLRREALGLITIFLGGKGVKEFFEHIENMNASTNRLARTMDMNTDDVAAWQGAINQVGGSAESAKAALVGLSRAANGFDITGRQQMLPILSRLGINLHDFNGKIKTGGQLWRELGQAIQGMDKAKATSFLSMIPGVNDDMINLLLKGPSFVNTALKESRQFAGSTKEAGDQAERVQRIWSLIGQAIDHAGTVMYEKFIGPMEEIIGLSILKELQKSPEEAAKNVSHEGLVKKFGEPSAASDALNAMFTYSLKASGMSRGVYAVLFGEKSAATFYDPLGKMPAPATTGPTGPTTFVPADMMTPPPGFGPKLILDRVPPLGVVAPGAGTSIVRNRWSRSGGSSSSTVNIGSVTVNAPHATDARGVARGFGTALDGYIRRSREAGHANGGTL